MSKSQFPIINEMKRAAATAMLTVGVAIAFFGVPGLFVAHPDSKAVEVETTVHAFPTGRQAGGTSPTFSTGGVTREKGEQNQCPLCRGLHYNVGLGDRAIWPGGGDSWRRLRREREIELTQ